MKEEQIEKIINEFDDVEEEQLQVRNIQQFLTQLILPELTEKIEKDVINKNVRTGNLDEKWLVVLINLGSFAKDIKILFGDGEFYKEILNDYQLVLNLSGSKQAKIINATTQLRIEKRIGTFEEVPHKK